MNEELYQTADFIKEVIRAKAYVNPLAEMLGDKPNPFKGMCYVASALLYQLYDGAGMTLYKKRDNTGQFHWWIRTDDGETIDITAGQYEDFGIESPSKSYDGAVVAKLMWFPSYKRRIDLLKQDLEEYIKSKLEK